MYVKLILKDKKGCRQFYDLMIQSKMIELTNKWMQELGFINEEEHNCFNKIIRSIKEIRLKDFQYKVTNKILVKKSFLHKINKFDKNICEYCNLQPEIRLLILFHLVISSFFCLSNFQFILIYLSRQIVL